MLAGGPRHPEADAEGSLREGLATMTAHPDWTLHGHAPPLRRPCIRLAAAPGPAGPHRGGRSSYGDSGSRVA
jgi:hypothetical protein